jgi:hypothetical protein
LSDRTRDLEKTFAELLSEDARDHGIRPSVLQSDFFEEYSLGKLLENPEAAYYSLFHTRGIGDAMRLRVAQAVAAKLQEIWPEPWQHVVSANGGAREQNAQDWPEEALRAFMAHWLPDGQKPPAAPRLGRR